MSVSPSPQDRAAILARLLEQPRVPLANLPTPITPVAWRWGNVRLYLKRDDLTGSGLMGNKVRKLEYLVAEAQRQGCDTLVTCGGVQSNHTRATAIAATMTGMRAVLVLAGNAPESLEGNLLLSRMLGADVRILPPMSGDYRHARMLEIAEQLRAQGRHPYVMPTGGSNEVGALGYVRAMVEIAEQLARDHAEIGCIVHACGSGGTYAGCYLGKQLNDWGGRHVAAIVEGTTEGWREALFEYVGRTTQHWSVDRTIRSEEIELIDAAGIGYALNTDEELDFIVAFARQTGIFLDPVYTGKALYALDREIRSGRFAPGGDVLFVHTGGLFGLFAKQADLVRVMDRCDQASS